MAAEWNLEKGSIEITATANAEGGTTQTVSQGGSSAEDSNPTITSNGNQTGYTITIKAGGGTTANVTIKDTNISTGNAAIKTEGKGNVKSERGRHQHCFPAAISTPAWKRPMTAT